MNSVQSQSWLTVTTGYVFQSLLVMTLLVGHSSVPFSGVCIHERHY